MLTYYYYISIFVHSVHL